MKILLALDGSPHSDAALDEIRQRPWPPASVVRILSVIEPFTPPVAELGLTPSWEEIDRSRATQAEVLTARAAASLQSTNVQVETKVRAGNPHRRGDGMGGGTDRHGLTRPHGSETAATRERDRVDRAARALFGRGGPAPCVGRTGAVRFR